MKKGVLALGFLMLLAVPVLAGYKFDNPVTVSLSGRYAYGALGSVRNSADVNSHIGCSINSDGAITCRAVDSTASQLPQCSVANPTENMRRAVSSLNGDSYVYFTWNSSWACTYIYVENNSQYKPK